MVATQRILLVVVHRCTELLLSITGPGVGKGRQIASVIFENLLRGRKKVRCCHAVLQPFNTQLFWLNVKQNLVPQLAA